MKRTIYIIGLILMLLTGCTSRSTATSTDIQETETKAVTTGESIENIYEEVPSTKKAPELEKESPETKTEKSDTTFARLNGDDFLEAFKEFMNICDVTDGESFKSDGKTFNVLIISHPLGNCYLAYSLRDDNTVSDIYMTCSRGSFVSFYVSTTLMSVDPEIDFKSALEKLGITDEDDGEEGIQVLQREDMNIVFERKSDKCVLAIMFY